MKNFSFTSEEPKQTRTSDRTAAQVDSCFLAVAVIFSKKAIKIRGS